MDDVRLRTRRDLDKDLRSGGRDGTGGSRRGGRGDGADRGGDRRSRFGYGRGDRRGSGRRLGGGRSSGSDGRGADRHSNNGTRLDTEGRSGGDVGGGSLLSKQYKFSIFGFRRYFRTYAGRGQTGGYRILEDSAVAETGKIGSAIKQRVRRAVKQRKDQNLPDTLGSGRSGASVASSDTGRELATRSVRFRRKFQKGGEGSRKRFPEQRRSRRVQRRRERWWRSASSKSRRFESW